MGKKKGRPKKRWKEVLECDMTARGLQRLDAQDCERWRLGCKNQLTPACGNLCWAPEIEGGTLLEQNDVDVFDILLVLKINVISGGIAKGGAAARPGCHHFGVTPFYNTKQKRKPECR